MSLAVFDMGGSSIKYGIWEQQTLSQLGHFATPSTFEKLKLQLKQVIAHSKEEISGVAISAPGAVNVTQRKIDGISAIPYIHQRPIFGELEDALNLPVTIENDANCAGICEMMLGAGKHSKHAIFLVIGTGVGGAIFINRHLYKGAHLFGGEIGLMHNQNKKTLSHNGTAVNTAHRFSEKYGNKVTGIELFEQKDAGDQRATQAIETMYEHLADSLYNIQVSLDPETIILGGGISARNELAKELQSRLQILLTKEGVAEILPEIKTCHYQNNANLIGAALNFEAIQKDR
ncbi:ROK family protein [Tetragenococcus osmophilus]|uniref:N-acetylmannosamine kinase n=1 Tax=Tetragenococcus osmophilus TaxID=526944 RepID=A0AA37XMG6_9ENTE|nr:ROK family protein [Tetragenococcus osmophilus]AYW47606.1 ROK family protein [Tetragenococcus osmophilus]GMA53233.1 N-acetylmannosamine kinase [Alicyclobacillus contaminans]GMA72795.1 N-acetylmannosamine kinase [Tetragenococcus osmophilus]